MVNLCNLLQRYPIKTCTKGEYEFIPLYLDDCSETDVKVEPLNIAIPTSLIVKGVEELQLTLYVQLSNGFLSKEQLKYAVEVLVKVSITDFLDMSADAVLLHFTAR